jgi:hypothetical protein
MMVKQNHQHVSPDGLCFLPYIHEWTDRSNVITLVEIASSVFSIEPPLFTKPAAHTVSTPSPSPSTYNATPSGRPNASPHTAMGYGTPGMTPTPAMVPVPSNPRTAGAYESYATPVPVSAAYANNSPMATAVHASSNSAMAIATVAQTGGGVAMQPHNHTHSHSHSHLPASTSSNSLRAEEERRLQLVDQVTMRLYEAVDTKQRLLRDQLDQQIAAGSALDQSAEAAQKALSDLKQAKGMYAEALGTLTEKNAAFDTWLAEEGGKPALPAVDRLVPYDALSAQIVRLSAEVNAIDDAFYYLERALASSRNESVDLTTFQRECRSLARTQFLSKAHLRKITAEAMQQQADRAAQQAGQAGQTGQAPLPQAGVYPQQHQPQPLQYQYQYPPAPAGTAASFAPYSAVPYPSAGYS